MAATVTSTPSSPSTDPSTSLATGSTGVVEGPASLRLPTVKVGLVAAAVTAAVAAGLHAAGVSFAIDGEPIPVLAFAQMVLLGAVIGGVIAGSLRKRSARAHQRFLQVTVALTTASCIPSVALPPAASTKLALVATHLVAAAIVIPFLARRLAD